MVVLPISIHAPTRGATACEALAAKTVVFQSTLPRGERRMGKIDTSGLSNFNPRSHEGSDNRTTFYYLPVSLISIHAPTRGATYCICRLVSDWTISIHAPTRGATPVLLSDMVSDGYFNPRSHEGSDGRAITNIPLLAKFQSTLPRGERQLLLLGRLDLM